MKIRAGFVSNSSSSSFVLRKDEIPDSLQLRISELVEEHNNNSNEGYLYESERHYFGDLCHHSHDLIDLLCRNKIPFDSME